MKRIVLIFAAVLLCGVAYGQESQRLRLEKHLYTLASDSLRGREAGTPDGKKAAEYILAQWHAMGLKPELMPFHPPMKPQYAENAEKPFSNLVAVIEGSDPVLKDEYIVIGAHYDHIGMRGGQVCNGADDNASGSSCLIEVARQLLVQKSQLKRSVIICAFDAEEKGLYGSRALVDELRNRKMLDHVKLMLSVDMVGWYKANGKLILDGSGTLSKAQNWLDPKVLGCDIKVHFKPFESSAFTATDTEPFASSGIPTLAVTTGLKSPYHKPEDDADLIDYEGLDHITDYLTALTIAASRREGKIASGQLAAKHAMRHFEVGIAIGANRSHLEFPDAVISAKGHFGFQGGLLLQYNLNRAFSLRGNLLYNYTNCPLPAPDDAYGKGFGLEQHSLLVPVILQLGVRESGVNFYVGLGGFYGRVLDGRFYGDLTADSPHYIANPNQAGMVFNIGFRMGGHWQIEGIWYNQMNDLFGSDLPKTRLFNYTVSLGYYF